MKKYFAVLCMITCIFGLTACGTKEVSVKESSQYNMLAAEYIAKELMVPNLLTYADDKVADAFLEEYSPIEAKAIFENDFAYFFNLSQQLQSYAAQYGGSVEEVAQANGIVLKYKINTDLMLSNVKLNGIGVVAGISSFQSSCKDMGDITEIGDATSEVIKNEIFVYVPIKGQEKSGTAEFIFKDNIFLTLDSAVLNVESSMTEKMERAALNTVLGMGTVFAVLILISFIIGAFGFIPKMQASLADKKNNKNKSINENETSVNNVIAQIIKKEESELVDDLELVAVISAAIAASQGAGSTDGFIVRSIKRANTNKWQKA
ncbi:MAG TPA: OadG family transporter subunit [Lachnospiraceae bacterium]|nr:OadG family transporter subunit [Lachnospiraceae bacterium]